MGHVRQQHDNSMAEHAHPNQLVLDSQPCHTNYGLKIVRCWTCQSLTLGKVGWGGVGLGEGKAATPLYRTY